MVQFELVHEMDDNMSEMMREHLNYGKNRITHFLTLMDELNIPFPKDIALNERRKILPLPNDNDCLYLEAIQRNGEKVYRFVISYTHTLDFRFKE